MAYTQTTEAIQALRARVTGSVLTPDAADYESTRRGWNLLIDHHPALILVAENAQDVVEGVRFAADEGLGVAVQLTGHGIQQPADDALLIVTARMNAVTVDAAARTARVESGALWKHVLPQTTPHGLAPLLGTAPHVGVTGYTLGGGVGWLARKYGFAADSLRTIDVVTPDGTLRRATPSENTELFWGLRGGGGNFGVVTALEFDLYPVETVYGGTLIYPGEVAVDALRFFREWAGQAPVELTSSIAVVKFPNLPQLPEAMRGKIQVVMHAVYVGEPEAGAALIRPWLDWRAPLTNTFGELPFADIGTVSNDPVNPVASYGSNEMFDSLSDDALDTIARFATNPASPLMFCELRHFGGGALARNDAPPSAIGHRDAAFYFLVGSPAFSPEMKAGAQAYIGQLRDALRPYVRGGVYQNFMAGAEACSRAQDAYGEAALQRLRALKAKVDPNNAFRYSYQIVTIEPAPAGR